MYILVQYSDYKKENSIEIHGYHESLEYITKCAKDLLHQSIDMHDDNYMIQINEFDYGEYIRLSYNDNSKVICKLRCVRVNKTTEDECNKVCESIRENMDEERNNIYIGDFVNNDYIDEYDHYVNKYKNVPLNDNDIKHLIDYIKLNDKNTILYDEIEYDKVYYSTVMGIVITGKL